MKEELVKYIGLELADIRKTKGYLIIDVAEKTKINKDTISKYENGNSSMKILILAKFLDFYNISIVYFFTKVYDRVQSSQ